MNLPLTPLDLARRAFKVYPERLAVVQGELELTYGEFARRTYQFARLLGRAGIVAGDHVALLAPNTLEAILAFHAVPLAGAVLVPLNVRFGEPEYTFLLRHADIKLALVDGGLLPGVQHLLSAAGIPAIDLTELDAQLTAMNDLPLPLPAGLSEDAPISINYTSGTTEDPKGVMLTHRNTYLGALNLMYHLDLRPGSVYLHVLPLAHANGWGGVWAATGAGATHVALPEAGGPNIQAQIERRGVTHLCASPSMLQHFADPLSGPPLLHRVRATVAGSPPHAQFIGRLEARGFEVQHVYGLVETSPLVTVAERTPETLALPPEERARVLSRQGYEMLAGAEVEVHDESGCPVPPDGEQLGEIVVRGNLVMRGYYKNRAATRRALAGGWFHTGDVACLHPDGRLEIRDRSKDMIISGGEHLSSVEVESVLYRHPSVNEAVVVSGPHAALGEVPVAFVVLHPGAQLQAAELSAFTRPHLAPFKVPERIEFVPELPKTASGKVLKSALREQVWAGHARPIG